MVTVSLREASEVVLLLVLHCHLVAYVGSSKGAKQESKKNMSLVVRVGLLLQLLYLSKA